MLCEVLRIRSGLLYRVQPGDALTETAPQYPDQDFAIVDTVVDEPNVANYLFREQEGSFLMGVLAGRLTETEFSAGAGSTDPDSTTVGFVGGVDSPVIRRFQAGFEAGVDYASDNVDVTTSYVGSYADPSGGQEAALSMYQNGVDIVYHASGATGVGVFQAAQAEGRFAFGVDQDQSISNESFADVILASMVKRVDTAVYESISNIIIITTTIRVVRRSRSGWSRTVSSASTATRSAAKCPTISCPPSPTRATRSSPETSTCRRPRATKRDTAATNPDRGVFEPTTKNTTFQRSG